MKNLLKLLVFFLLVISLSDCSRSEPENKEAKNLEEAVKNLEREAEKLQTDGQADLQDAQKDMQEAMKEMQEKAKGLQGKEGKVEVVNFRKLKEHLPVEIAGMKRSSSSGESTGAMGFKISTAEADYKKDDHSLEVKIVDAGGMGFALMGLAAWATLEIDKEDDNGYERTTTFDGYKVYEKYNARNKRGEFTAIIADRFVVTLESDHMEMKDLKKAFHELNPKELAKLK